MAYADFSRFVVTTDFSAREISRDKPPVFPRLPSQSTHTGYGCLLDFVTLCPLIRRLRLSIGFLFVGLRFRYPFLSPAPRSANLGSRFGVRRQLRPLWTFTTDRRHARRTKKPGSIGLLRKSRAFVLRLRYRFGYLSTDWS